MVKEVGIIRNRRDDKKERMRGKRMVRRLFKRENKRKERERNKQKKREEDVKKGGKRRKEKNKRKKIGKWKIEVKKGRDNK